MYKKYIGDLVGSNLRTNKTGSILNKKLSKSEIIKIRDLILNKVKNIDHYNHHYGLKSIAKLI